MAELSSEIDSRHVYGSSMQLWIIRKNIEDRKSKTFTPTYADTAACARMTPGIYYMCLSGCVVPILDIYQLKIQR